MSKDTLVKLCKSCLLFLFLVSSSFGADFLRGRWDGIEVQAYDFGNSVNVIRFVASGPDVNGYVTLYAKPSLGDSQPIFTTRLDGVYLQSYTAPDTEIIDGFLASADTGFVYLSAHTDKGSTGDIFRARWVGIEGQTAEASGNDVIHGFTTWGPDSEGFVYLGFTEGPAETEEPAKKEVLFSWAVYSNPGSFFNIKYSVPGQAGDRKKVSLKVYDLQGREVKTIIDSDKNVGCYSDKWDCMDGNGKKVSTGIYFVKFKTVGVEKVKKIVVVR